MLKKLGVPVVVDQIDPARVEEQMVQEEVRRWPGWEEYPGRIPDMYFSRLAEEWNQADLVLVNSNWSRRALAQQGVEEKKIIVVPLCYEKGAHPPSERPPTEDGKPLTVLWLGQMILRKGIPYFFEAAAKLLKANVQFVAAGRIGISEKGMQAAPANISFVGRATREQTAKYYSEADLFVLPTISDGFALTQLEAMAFGLPVIATPNCGDVVTHGVDGLIVPPRDSDALANAIASLESDRGRLRKMSAKARETVKHPRFTLDGYADAVESGLAVLGNR
jgi:glycosyltransferase involved in cell wall biosynthesis